MADSQREKVHEAAKRVGLQTIGGELERRIGCGGCPAAQFIGSVREDGMPGLRCRVTHDTLSLGSDPNAILRWCSKAPWEDLRHSDDEPKLNGYDNCPTWEFEKLRLALGMRSLGDEAELDALSERTWREDVTGSAYGDLSMFEEVNQGVRDTLESWAEQQDQAMPGTGLTEG